MQPKTQGQLSRQQQRSHPHRMHCFAFWATSWEDLPDTLPKTAPAMAPGSGTTGANCCEHPCSAVVCILSCPNRDSGPMPFVMCSHLGVPGEVLVEGPGTCMALRGRPVARRSGQTHRFCAGTARARALGSFRTAGCRPRCSRGSLVGVLCVCPVCTPFLAGLGNGAGRTLAICSRLDGEASLLTLEPRVLSPRDLESRHSSL